MAAPINPLFHSPQSAIIYGQNTHMQTHTHTQEHFEHITNVWEVIAVTTPVITPLYEASKAVTHTYMCTQTQTIYDAPSGYCHYIALHVIRFSERY